MEPIAGKKPIETAVERNAQHMLRAAYAILHSTSDAQDAVQEAFLKLLEKEPAFRDASHEKAWLLRVTINIAKNEAKRSRRFADEPPPEPALPPEEVSDVFRAVLVLPEPYRIVIHLYYYEGYSIREIARILHLPVPTVGTRLRRGRERLKTILEQEDV
jgi:RNA polymerase sigma-70 factor (ECF subfamily)